MYVGVGYQFIGSRPGNVLLAFGVGWSARRLVQRSRQNGTQNMTTRTDRLLTLTLVATGLLVPAGMQAQPRPLRIDHFVPVVSTAPSMHGETAQIYVRERTLGSTSLRGDNLAGRVTKSLSGQRMIVVGDDHV